MIGKMIGAMIGSPCTTLAKHNYCFSNVSMPRVGWYIAPWIGGTLWMAIIDINRLGGGQIDTTWI